MVNNLDDSLDLVFHALADRTRRDILRRLAQGDLSISELAESYDMSLVAVSKHVKVLEKANLVETSKEGRLHRCVMRFEPLETASDQLKFYMKFWSDQMDGLEKFVDGVMNDEAKNRRRRKD